MRKWYSENSVERPYILPRFCIGEPAHNDVTVGTDGIDCYTGGEWGEASTCGAMGMDGLTALGMRTTFDRIPSGLRTRKISLY